MPLSIRFLIGPTMEKTSHGANCMTLKGVFRVSESFLLLVLHDSTNENHQQIMIYDITGVVSHIMGAYPNDHRLEGPQRMIQTV